MTLRCLAMSSSRIAMWFSRMARRRRTTCRLGWATGQIFHGFCEAEAVLRVFCWRENIFHPSYNCERQCKTNDLTSGEVVLDNG